VIKFQRRAVKTDIIYAIAVNVLRLFAKIAKLWKNIIRSMGVRACILAF
jgi:hypothetical protein